MRVALTIAGSDPSGGAGIQADLKTFHQHGVYGEAVITLLTVQNTISVSRVQFVEADLVAEQLRAVLDDIPPNAIKTGALGSKAVVEAVSRAAESFTVPLVIDPVMISKHGAPLMDQEAQVAFRDLLVSKAFLITPNLHEAAALTGMEVADVDAMQRAAEKLHSMGARHVVVKGGHLNGTAVDVLFSDGTFHRVASERIETIHTHGTGCTFSAAITALLAKGTPVVTAVSLAKDYITRAIRENPGLGGGSGPVNHHV